MYSRHLHRTYNAREISVMQELEKHNLTRIADVPADSLSNFEEISYKLSLLSALLIGFNSLQNSEITAVYGN